MKVKDILNGNTQSGSKTIGHVIVDPAYREEQLEKLKQRNINSYQFAIEKNIFGDEKLVFIVRNGFGYVATKNGKITEKLNDTDIITDKEWNQFTDVLKEKIIKSYGKTGYTFSFSI